MNRIDIELIEAIGENNPPEVCRLLRAGADIEAKDIILGFTPLVVASKEGHLQVLKELLEHGADIDAESFGGMTALHFACSHEHLAVVNELLSPNASNGTTTTILGKRKSLAGANIEAKEFYGDTPLHLASMHDSLAIVKALLSGGADILAVNSRGELPLHYAVSVGYPAIAKYLLQQLYATTRRLPLHELLEDLTFLVKPDSLGVPPLRTALDEDVLRTDDVVEILEYLVGRNPELLSSRDHDGSLPLHVACRRGASFPIVQSLVNHCKASVKSVTPQGDLPLFLACEMSETSLDTIFLLMKLYPDLLCCLEENLFSDSDASSQQAMLLEKSLEESKQLKAEIAELKSELSAKDKKLEQIEGENANLAKELAYMRSSLQA
jgi:ankyrin repeat protein